MYYYFFINRYFVSYKNQKLCENVKFTLRVIRDCLSRCMSTSRNFFRRIFYTNFTGTRYTGVYCIIKYKSQWRSSSLGNFQNFQIVVRIVPIHAKDRAAFSTRDFRLQQI